MKKKLLSLLLAGMMVIGMLPVAASAGEPATTENSSSSPYQITVVAEASMPVSNETEEQIKARGDDEDNGANADISVTLKNTASSSEEPAPNVQVQIAVSKPDETATAHIMAKDTSSQWWDVVDTGKWGPDEGFSIPSGYDVTTNFYAAFNAPGTYTATIQLVDVSSEEVLTTAEAKIDVTAEAKIDGTYYGTLEEAVTAAQESNATVELINDVDLSDATESINISKSLTIDGKDTYTITGDVDSTNVYFNVTGGTFTLQNVTLKDFGGDVSTVSQWGVVKATTSGTVHATNVKVSNFNRAAFDIRSGTENKIENCAIDCKNNATDKLTKGVLVENATATITGTTITNAASTYEDWNTNAVETWGNSTVTINNSTLGTADAPVKNGVSMNTGNNESTVTLTNTNVYAETRTVKLTPQTGVESGSVTGSSTLTIKSGSYFGTFKINQGTVEGAGCTISVEGGSFTSDPTPYLAGGSYVHTQDGTYGFLVNSEKPEGPVADVAPAAPSVEPVKEEEVASSEADKILLDSIQSALTPEGEDDVQPALNEDSVALAARKVAEQNTITEEEARTKLKESISVGDEDTVYVVIVPTMSIAITNVTAAAGGEPASFTLDITPEYRTVATTADVSKGEEILLDEESKNAVYLDTKPTELKLGNTEVTVPLPGTFADGGSPLYVGHYSHYHEGTVADNILTFTTEGFSEFIISNGTQTPVAQIGQNIYTSLKAAVADLDDGETLQITGEPAEGDKPALEAGMEFVVTVQGAAISEDNLENYFIVPSNVNVSVGTDGTITVTSKSTGGGGTGSTSYTVTVGTFTNGKVTANPTSAAKGDKVTLNVAPAEGYELGTLTVKDASGKTVSTTKVSATQYTFVMPEGNVTVSATFVLKNATPFTDIKTTDWWYEAVKYVYENKLMAGTSTTTFAPKAKLNRAQAVQILYNLEGQPAVTGTADFTDTAAAGDWAVKAITWGSANGVVAGVGNGKFDPAANVTREQFAQMMYNYAKYKGYDLSAAGDLNNFSDISKVSDWAKTALSWANGEGLINGNENGTLNPVGTAIRGEAASIMSKFDQNVAK